MRVEGYFLLHNTWKWSILYSIVYNCYFMAFQGRFHVVSFPLFLIKKIKSFLTQLCMIHLALLDHQLDTGRSHKVHQYRRPILSQAYWQVWSACPVWRDYRLCATCDNIHQYEHRCYLVQIFLPPSGYGAPERKCVQPLMFYFFFGRWWGVHVRNFSFSYACKIVFIYTCELLFYFPCLITSQ